MGFGLFWILFLIALPFIGISGLIIWLISTNKKVETSNNALRTGIIVTILLVVIIGLIFGIILLNQFFRWFNFGPGGMMGSRLNYWRNTPTWMQQMWPGMGMHTFRPGNCIFRQRGSAVLTVEETKNAVKDFLAVYGNDDLIISEIMIFDNNGYAVITEMSTGIGAFELLIDPVDKYVYPEYGPNRMWNLKYGMHGRAGMMAGRMGTNWRQRISTDQNIPSEMPISVTEAQAIAQDYLDEDHPGAVLSDHLTPFYGYYTIDVERDANIFGMLSVNGFTGQVFYHHWHGEFIEMVEHQ